MSDRPFALLAPPSSWPWFGRSTRGFGRPAGFERRDARFGRPDFAPAPRPTAPGRPNLRAMLRAAWRRHRTRRCLTELDAYLLKDIGISYAEAEAEANKPFWVG